VQGLRNVVVNLTAATATRARATVSDAATAAALLIAQEKQMVVV
jgi:hypothetical protein